MRSFFAFFAAVLAVTVIFVILHRTPAARRFLERVAFLLLAPAVFLCRVASRIVDFFLSPRGSRRRVAWWKYGVWLAIAALPLALFFENIARPLPLPPSVDPGYLLIVAALFHVLVLGAALLIVYEDYDVMDGVVAVDARRIGGVRSATRFAVIAASIALFLIYAIAAVYWLAEVVGVELFDQRPETGFPLVDYALVGLWSLPSAWLLRAIDWFLGSDTSVAFKVTLIARTTYYTIYVTGSFLLVGLVSMVIKETLQLRRIVAQLGEIEGDEQRYLITRAVRAPPVIKAGILRAALTEQDKERQKRLMTAAREIGVFTFPQTFFTQMRSYGEEIQLFGLDQALQMFHQRRAVFDREPCEVMLRASAYQMQRGKLSADVTRKLLRLMIDILHSKRGVIQVSGKLKTMIASGVGKELAGEKAKTDAALRGLLQDLRRAVGNSSNQTPPPQAGVGWIKRLGPTEAPGAQPDSPAPTTP